MAGEGRANQEIVDQVRTIIQSIPPSDLATLRAAIVAAVEAVPDAAKMDIVTAVVQAVPDAAKGDIATTALEAVPDAGKADIVSAALQTVPDAAKAVVATAAVEAVPDAAKAGIATTALEAVPDAGKAAVAATAVQNLSAGQREAIFPTQRVTDQVWLIIVGAFALVFVLSSLALFWAAYLDLTNAQMLLTVVTTVAGVLAGFVGGRSAATGATRPPGQ
jgi:hypothetical protein